MKSLIWHVFLYTITNIKLQVELAIIAYCIIW
jgi:hypothetical protein